MIGKSTCVPRGREVDVSATVTDDTELDEVVLVWSGAGDSGSTEMSGSGSTWRGTMGPLPRGGEVTLRVIATDEQGNTTSGPSTTTEVDSCAV